jgi:uncharacterized membrane protein YozB (DUF420 family)
MTTAPFQTPVAAHRTARRLERLLWVLTFVLVFIGIMIVMRRTVQIFYPAPPRAGFPDAAALDAGFAPHPVLTLMHIFPGLVFVLLAPIQLMRSVRSRWPKLHRWMGRVVAVAGMVIGVTALVMSPRMAIGGVNETVATSLFGALFLVFLIKGFVAIRRREPAAHREWMIRAFAVAMAVATIRPIVGIFFATRMLTHLTPQQFFGTAFWLGFTVQLIVAEVWINYTRPAWRSNSSSTAS